MSDKRRELSDFVRATIQKKGLSYRDVSDRSHGAISPATIGQIINMQQGQLKASTVEALAAGLGEPRAVLFALAFERLPVQGEEFEASRFAFLYSLYSRLTEEERDRSEPILEMFQMYLEKKASLTIPIYDPGGLSPEIRENQKNGPGEEGNHAES